MERMASPDFDFSTVGRNCDGTGRARASRGCIRESLAIAAIYPVWPEKEILAGKGD